MGTNTEMVRDDPLYIGLRRPSAPLEKVSDHSPSSAEEAGVDGDVADMST